MRMDKAGQAIANARKKCKMTQSQLAERIGVSVQAVSKWEHGKNLPDIENLMLICETTNTPYQLILLAGEKELSCEDLHFKARLFREENMYTRMKSMALSEELTETYRALSYMKAQHLGQFRKQAKFTTQAVQYINHPLLMACQAHALGIREDAVLAAILLHDVVEDTDATVEELPFGDEVKELVALVTFVVPEGTTKEEAKEQYYAAIEKNAKACLIKIIDRCNNVSTMAASFSKERMLDYIRETEQYVLPLTTILKNGYPQYNDAAFLLKYQITGIIETIKNLIVF